MTSTSRTALECRDHNNVAGFSVDATNGFKWWRHLIMNIYVIAGARHIGEYNDIAAGNDITLCYTITGKYE